MGSPNRGLADEASIHARPDRVPRRSDAPAVAIIPARGGSKGLPGKNVARVGRSTLIRRAIDACLACELVGEVVVSTDSEEIATEAIHAGATVVHRPADLAGDLATSESALLHALDARPDLAASVVAFVQCTSPFIDSGDLRRAIDLIASAQADSAFSAASSHAFLWRLEGESMVGINHDSSVRARRQDREEEWRETGAFYVMSLAGFKSARHRFFGRIAAIPVAAEHAIEIDSMVDLELSRCLDSVLLSQRQTVDLSHIHTVVTDFDGVHTAGTVEVSEQGLESVVVNRRDGHGISMLRREGIRVLILSTERNGVVQRRADKLQVDCIQGSTRKVEDLLAWLSAERIDGSGVAYIGDDVNDLECFASVSVAVAVADAHPMVKRAANLVLQSRGGEGAVRDLAERVLSSRGRLPFE